VGRAADRYTSPEVPAREKESWGEREIKYGTVGIEYGIEVIRVQKK
jgi:hypothetical protein